MTLKECYQILKVDQSASLEDVKRAYRRRAFELHPDLNPQVRDASRQFQLLNEAYVILTRLVTAREAAEQRRQEQPQEQSFASRWNSWSFSFGGKKPDAKAEPKAENSEERRAEREEAYREEMRREEARRREEKIHAMREEEANRERDRQARKEQEHAEHERQEQEKKEQERLEKEQQERERLEQEQLEKDRIEKERQAERRAPPRPGSSPSAENTASSASSATPGKSGKSRKSDTSATAPPRPPRPGSNEHVYAEQQEVLRDILNDSFARRVFEDIYSEIRKKGPQPEHTEAPRSEATQKEKPRERTVLRPNAVSVPPPTTPKSGFSFGLEQFGLDFSKGMGNTVKGWLRSQIDEEQTIRLPATGLFPGARVRLQIRRGLSDDLTTLEVVLPTDFVVGKPIRLRGMGKRLGSVQGDLYLTLLSR